MNKKIKSGYTVIEILLILAIVVLVVSIILINLSTIQLRAERAAILVEQATVLRSIEECFLNNHEVYCGGIPGTRTSSHLCHGGVTDQPVRETAICGSAMSPNVWSDKVWPNVAKNRYAYGGFVESDGKSGRYAIALYRDRDADGQPDDNNMICCTNTGCIDMTFVSDVSNCHTSGGF
jgi:hypothetical protein